MSDNESVMKKVKKIMGLGGRRWDIDQGATNLAWTGVIKKISLGGCFVRGLNRKTACADRLNQSVTWPALYMCLVAPGLNHGTQDLPIFLLPRDTKDL